MKMKTIGALWRVNEETGFLYVGVMNGKEAVVTLDGKILVDGEQIHILYVMNSDKKSKTDPDAFIIEELTEEELMEVKEWNM